MMDVGRHPNIELLVNSEVKELSGTAGNFSVKILKKASFVDWNKCNSCGLCSEKCPTKVPSEFDQLLGIRKAIYTPFPQAVPSKPRIDKENCLYFKTGKCRVCEKFCPASAINFDMKDEHIKIKVGSIVVATGIDYYDPSEASEYGYGRFKNVITSLELERLLSAGGPTKGELIRHTDNKVPKRIAFIQCIGSRNMKRDIRYCSRICCMNAIKASLIIREHFPEAEITIFYIDIRAFGKGFEEFYNRSIKQNIKYIRGKPSKITEDPNTKDLILAYENTETGEIQNIKVDMAVLSAALVPANGTQELAEALGIELDEDGFFKEKDPCGYPLDSTRPGIYLCGCATSPKDITDSIAEACGAAVRASLHVLPHKVKEEKVEITPLDISGKPRIGVFVCHCGLNIAGVIDVVALQEYAKTLPNVVYAEDCLFACAEAGQRRIQEMIVEHRLNRVVVAACTPKTHEPIFRETLEKVGLNPYLFEMTNIRDQCSWVHAKEPTSALMKAKDLIRMAVAKVSLLQPLERRELEVKRDALIIGGGIAGIQAAIDLTNQGFSVYLVEKEPQLGGRVAKLATLYPSGISGKDLIDRKVSELKKNRVKILTSTEVKNVTGFVGNFDVELKTYHQSKIARRKLQVGAIILAIGADLYKPNGSYGYGKYPNVFTNMELEQIIIEDPKSLDTMKSVAFIQCVGSRGEANMGCSRYCCQAAMKQAIFLRKKGINVTIFNRGIRVYAKEAEKMYREARGLGVLFIPYEPNNKPRIIGNSRATEVEIDSELLNMTLTLPVDAVILSVGMLPRAKDSQQLAELLKVPRGADKFFMERHPKFGPVETTMEGIFLCGCAQFPKDIADSIAQSSAVASKVSTLLSKGKITLEPITAYVNEELCRGCGRCAEICEFNAIEVKDGTAEVNEALCKGCGSCAAVCPTSALELRQFTSKQIEAMLEAMLVT